MNVPKLTKKQKKGLAFRERKGKKPLLESDALLEEESAIPQADPPAEEEAQLVVSEARRLPLIKPKKRKRDAEKDLEDNPLEIQKGDTEDPQPKKTKKRKLEDDADEARRAVGKTRFILFVGTYSRLIILSAHLCSF